MENLDLSDSLKSDLLETSRWGKFMAIVGFMSVGILLLLAFSLLFSGDLGGQMAGVSSLSIAVLYFVLGIVYLFPVYFLYKYSSQLKRALMGEDQYEFESAFRNLKKLFVFLGVVTAITLVFYTLAIIAVAVGGVIGKMV